MRKAPITIVMIMVLFLAGIMIVPGCGNGGEGQQLTLNEFLQQEGDSFTFEGSEGDLIVFSNGGTFRAVLENEVVDGTYKIILSNDVTALELSFADQDGTETWQETKNEQGEQVLTDTKGQTYILKGTEGGLRGG